ncbi:hypothetical protein D3C87_1697150 [compost metagenome]
MEEPYLSRVLSRWMVFSNVDKVVTDLTLVPNCDRYSMFTVPCSMIARFMALNALESPPRNLISSVIVASIP